MLDRWFPHATFPVSWETFLQLPQNPAYKYEYWDGAAHLTARPKFYHCLLDLTPQRPAEQIVTQDDRPVRFRSLAEADWQDFPQLFAAAFHRMPPFGLIEDEQRVTAAEECLQHTRTGGDGPLVPQASFVAFRSGDEQVVGAILITLMHAGDLEDFHGRGWRSSVPQNALEQRWGRPHLTWVFVSPWYARYGIGSALLGRSVNALLELGYSELASTFLLGNESSMLWHWKTGFRILGYPGSPGAIQRKVDAAGGEDHVQS